MDGRHLANATTTLALTHAVLIGMAFLQDLLRDSFHYIDVSISIGTKRGDLARTAYRYTDRKIPSNRNPSNILCRQS